MRAGAATIILVLASVVSACASVAGLTASVSIAAAVAAVMSGYQVFWTQLIPPLRMRSAENAAHLVVGKRGDLWMTGTAFQIAPDRWITAQHVIDGATEVFMRIQGTKATSAVIYQNTDTDIAVLSTGTRWPWSARASLSLPDSGAQVKVIGWTSAAEAPSIRVALDLHVLGTSERGLVVMGDASAQIGFSGGPVLDVSNGKVVGMVASVSKIGRSEIGGYGPEPIQVTYVRPISAVPAEYR